MGTAVRFEESNTGHKEVPHDVCGSNSNIICNIDERGNEFYQLYCDAASSGDRMGNRMGKNMVPVHCDRMGMFLSYDPVLYRTGKEAASYSGGL